MRTSIALALLLALSLPARADDAASAKEHARKGQVHYSLGEFDEAIAELREAYRLTNAPAVLFNIAQAYRQLSNWKQAYFYYAQYLSKRPDASNRADVEQFMTAMKKKLDEEEAQKAAAAAAAAHPEPALSTSVNEALQKQPPEQKAVTASTKVPEQALVASNGPAAKPSSSGGVHVAGYAALGAGALAGGLAFVFKGSAQAAADELNSKYQAGTLAPKDAHLKSDVESKGKLATLSAVGAGVLVVTGAVLAFAF